MRLKVGLHTVDLFPGRERLMPFRTVIEVAKVMKEHGWEADVLNSSVSENGAKDYCWDGINIIQCPRDFVKLSLWVNENGYDAFYFAAPIREGLKELGGFKLMKCRKIAYVPSGISPWENALWMFQRHGMYAKAWLFEAFTPKGLIGRKLKKAGFTDIIGLTEFTKQRVAGRLKGHTIYPGKDGFEYLVSDDSIVRKHELSNSKYYLFTGGPAPSRGGQELLWAFDRMADCISDAKLVYLVRKDVGGKYNPLYQVIGNLRNKEKVAVINDELSAAQLKAFFEQAYAVVLPFICIPAEVPITYYEVMSCGTPVVSYPNAGTTEYLADGIKICKGISINAMVDALKDLWNDEDERRKLGIAAKRIMEQHPDWHQVGLQWMGIIENLK